METLLLAASAASLPTKDNVVSVVIRVIRLASISVDIAYRLRCITTNCAHIIYHEDP